MTNNIHNQRNKLNNVWMLQIKAIFDKWKKEIISIIKRANYLITGVIVLDWNKDCLEEWLNRIKSKRPTSHILWGIIDSTIMSGGILSHILKYTLLRDYIYACRKGTRCIFLWYPPFWSSPQPLLRFLPPSNILLYSKAHHGESIFNALDEIWIKIYISSWYSR